jgi:geranylgeranyl diphosphate synthase type II
MDIKAYLSESKSLVDSSLKELLPESTVEPTTIHKAMRYSVFAGGKRVRPILVLASGRSVGGDRRVLLHIGAAVEMMHTYSLIHDDLPALDNDDLRRGVPTCHKVFGEAMAILAGDALMTRCYQVLAQLPGVSDRTRVKIIAEIAMATGTVQGMIGGQVVDLESEGKKVTTELLEYIHHSKTGALLTACIRSGALAADVADEELEILTRFGSKLGLVFQIVDDILDVTSTSEELGKTAGKDARSEKATFPALYGLESSRKKAQELVQSSLSDLEEFGEEADALRHIARYVLQRSA